MTVYQLDENNLFCNSIELNQSDICPKTGDYLIPGGCVEIEPPEIPDGKELFWGNGEWILRDKPLEPDEIL